MSLTITADFSGLNRYFDLLGEAAEAAVRPASQAAAQVLYDEVKRNVRRIKRHSGNLESSIYQVYSKDRSTKTRAVYHVSWNYRKAPHGILVEYGHWVRYQYYVDKRGFVRPMVRPEMQGKPPPRRGASRAVMDAYYVTLATPYKTRPQSFIRNAVLAYPAARDMAREVLVKRINEYMRSRK